MMAIHSEPRGLPLWTIPYPTQLGFFVKLFALTVNGPRWMDFYLTVPS
jgi:hypothetical protein